MAKSFDPAERGGKLCSKGMYMPEHVPVLVQEIVDSMQPERCGWILDGTLGLGGHTLALLRSGTAELRILGMDRDRESLELAESNLHEQGYASSVVLGHASYDNFPRVLKEAGLSKLDGALLDLGLSNLQIQDPERGFSFHASGSLDMRYDQGGGDWSAQDLVNKASREKLRDIIKRYGEEPMAGRIARFICEAREKSPIADTGELAEVVKRAYPAKKRAKSKNHPATRTFQALRIAVNQELDRLQNFLQQLPNYLTPGARIAIVSYHSLEDRIVKRYFQQQAEYSQYPPQPASRKQIPWRILTRKPITPSREEMEKNYKSRSAKLRVAEVLTDSTGDCLL